MEEKYLSVLGGAARLDPKTGPSPSQEQVLSWVDEVFHDLRQNKVRQRDKTGFRETPKH